MRVITDGVIPVKMWLEDIDDGALEQAENLANLPFAFKHIAIMPDAHQGYGMPIGGVMATRGVVVPNAVGVDIGCGMLAVQTRLTVEELPPLREVVERIRSTVPVGFSHHAIDQPGVPSPPDSAFVIGQQWEAAQRQLGTLGGGNHFIEVQADERNQAWLMIHSGSRNLGKQVADCYNKVAVDLNRRWFSSVPKEHQLAFLPTDIEEGQNYLSEMEYCVEFALANRLRMLELVVEAFGADNLLGDNNIINIAHNYAAMENHYGQNVLVHRKGATKAYEGQLGIIPGSQGTSSYIVEGLGNLESFKSCSHGAGRRMGRKQATRELNLADERRRMDEQGIIHDMCSEKQLDEAAGAYKDIDEVMEQQSDLVKIIHRMRPLAVVKG